MSYIQPLDNIPIWALFILTTIVFSIAAELGFRVGKFKHARLEKGQNPQVSTILGASLALLAFFLAFTFNMAGSRYDDRKKLVVDDPFERPYSPVTVMGTILFRAGPIGV